MGSGDCSQKTSVTILTIVDLQEEHLAQLRGLAFAAGVMDSFAMSSLLQLTFDVSQYKLWHLDAFGLTLGITVRPNVSSL
jgi:hypothetical protein